MKKILCFALMFCAISALADESGYLKGTNTIELAEDENLIVLWFSDEYTSDGPNRMSIEIQLPPYDVPTPETHTILITESTDTTGRTIFGPCKVAKKVDGNIVAYMKTSRDVFATPVNLIMIPIDYEGEVDLMVETSADLETWTPLYSANAGTSNSASFYRTRLITP